MMFSYTVPFSKLGTNGLTVTVLRHQQPCRRYALYWVSV